MDAHTLLAEWEVSPFVGGFAGLADLQSQRFSGVVETGSTRLFLRDGDPVAVVADDGESPHPGDVDAFENASGETYEAPHPAAVTLAAMLSLDGEVRGQYFTDDTPLSTVHETLSDGGFTGYVELSENVLSGDYYVVYVDGEASYLGVLGPSNRLITDEEAESKAESEIGIYSVVAVSLPDVELPEPASDPSESAVAGAAGGAVDETADEGGTPTDSEESNGGTTVGESPDTTPGDSSQTPPGDVATASEVDADSAVDAAEQPTATDPPTTDRESGSDAAGDQDEPSESERPVGAAADGSSSTPSGTDADTDTNPGPGDTEASTSRSTTTGGGRSSDPVMDDVTTRSVPSLDPENTRRAGGESTGDASPAGGTQTASESQDEQPERPDRTDRPERGTVEGLQERYESKIEELQSELNALRRERDELRERVSSLESSGGAAGRGQRGANSMTPASALEDTSLFVREDSRGGATLEDAHAGRTTREELVENLRIEHHTTFDASGATVDGEPFEAWLESSVPYAFAEWLVSDLLFEIRSTGSTSSMRHLYDALPDVDRIGFTDSVTIGDGKEGRTLSFDVVARNRMGDPVAVANIEDRRQPTEADSLEPLIDDGSDISMERDSLAGAFAVTSSYFEPGALSAAREATSGSLLSREKYRSYVKLSRTNGFHLCLVESRNGSFHLTVPEL